MYDLNLGNTHKATRSPSVGVCLNESQAMLGSEHCNSVSWVQFPLSFFAGLTLSPIYKTQESSSQTQLREIIVDRLNL